MPLPLSFCRQTKYRPFLKKFNGSPPESLEGRTAAVLSRSSSEMQDLRSAAEDSRAPTTRLALAIASAASQQPGEEHGHNPGEKNAIEFAGSSNGCHGRAQPANLA